MKKIIKINSPTKSYNILLQRNSILLNILNEQKINKKIFIIIDRKVIHLIKNLKTNNNTFIIKINGNEKIKSFENYKKLILKLISLKIERSSCIIAIGGGSIGDLSGFVADTILRGMEFILIPTTLLSQVDSSIGGKNGINTSYGKNLIGSFKQPNKVIIDPQALSTLSRRQIKSGYAEILKHALIKNKSFYLWLEKNCEKILNLEPNFVNKAIIESIKIKAHFVENDEQEKLSNDSSRAILNFGHTFGHALEAMNHYRNNLTHGEAISIGMVAAAKISKKINLINEKEYQNLILHLKKVKLPYYDKRIGENKIFKLILSDKKNLNNKINLILLKKIGKAVYKKGLKIDEIKKLLNY